MGGADRPLTDAQRRAAALLAQGRSVQEVASEVGVSTKTISSRWKRRDDFRALVRRHRESLVGETSSAEAVLTQALGATRGDGTPDWQTRVAAAKALMTTPVATPEAEEAAREAARERIYLPPDDGEEG